MYDVRGLKYVGLLIRYLLLQLGEDFIEGIGIGHYESQQGLLPTTLRHIQYSQRGVAMQTPLGLDVDQV